LEQRFAGARATTRGREARQSDSRVGTTVQCGCRLAFRVSTSRGFDRRRTYVPVTLGGLLPAGRHAGATLREIDTYPYICKHATRVARDQSTDCRSSPSVSRWFLLSPTFPCADRIGHRQIGSVNYGAYLPEFYVIRGRGRSWSFRDRPVVGPPTARKSRGPRRGRRETEVPPVFSPPVRTRVPKSKRTLICSNSARFATFSNIPEERSRYSRFTAELGEQPGTVTITTVAAAAVAARKWVNFLHCFFCSPHSRHSQLTRVPQCATSLPGARPLCCNFDFLRYIAPSVYLSSSAGGSGKKKKRKSQMSLVATFGIARVKILLAWWFPSVGALLKFLGDTIRNARC